MTAASAGSRIVAALLQRMDPRASSRVDVREHRGVPCIEARLPGQFRALFTTRVQDGNDGSAASFDLDRRSQTRRALVEQNLSRLKDVVGDVSGVGLETGGEVGRLRIISPLQVHGVRVVGAAEYAATLSDQGGCGDQPCDGLTVHAELDRGLAPLLLFADCVPIVMVGEVDMAVIHGGWRGIIGEIVHQGASAMTGPPGLAVIGPSIGPCCFQVSDDIAQAFSRRFGSEVVIGSNGSHRVDLWAAAERALGEVGVGPHQITNPRLCTACNNDLFFSYRADGPDTGRQGCLAWAVES